ncbi:MAG: hypothetical protein K9L65_03050 [Chromatiaceae bacterium]|nr:hypothetical protein [Chromatiaceae bacterium]
MSIRSTAPLKLTGEIHKVLTNEGYPFTGLLQQGETAIAFANGYVNVELTAGTVCFRRIGAPSGKPPGRPPDIGKKMGLGLVYQAYISDFNDRKALSKTKARKRLMPIFGYGSADAVKTALKRTLPDVADYRKALRHRMAAWQGDDLLFHVAAENWSFKAAGTEVLCTFQGWLWEAPNSRAEYGSWEFPIKANSPDNALAVVRQCRDQNPS